MQRSEMPYTLSLGDFIKGFPRLKGVKFYDVYDPAFAEKMGNVLRDRAAADPAIQKSINDPMCIGYFIDNELQFGRIMEGVLKSDAKQPAKQEFVKQLQESYKTVEELNKAWKSSFADWNAVAENKKGFKTDAYRKDNRKFQEKFVSRYFEICRKGIKSLAPHRLYLGCRFVGFRQAGYVWAAAAKNCDVVSVNSYCNSIYNANRGDFRDKPILMGEFHFGTYDRGMLSPSLSPVYDQKERATSFKRYVQGGLAHPNFVGAHYFQFRDQPLTGRFDGEGYQIGFVDVCDTPYPELTSAAREVGENMYSYRENGKLVNEMK